VITTAFVIMNYDYDRFSYSHGLERAISITVHKSIFQSHSLT